MVENGMRKGIWKQNGGKGEHLMPQGQVLNARIWNLFEVEGRKWQVCLPSELSF